MFLSVIPQVSKPHKKRFLQAIRLLIENNLSGDCPKTRQYFVDIWFSCEIFISVTSHCILLVEILKDPIAHIIPLTKRGTIITQEHKRHCPESSVPPPDYEMGQ